MVEFHRLAGKDHVRLEWLKDTLKVFVNFRNKQQVYEVCKSITFWYVKVCIFWKCIRYTIHWDKTQILQKLPSDNTNGTKNALFFFRELQLITLLFLICDSSMGWSTMFVSLKLCGIFNFRFHFVFVKVYIFVQQNEWTLKRHNFFQN